MAERAFSPRSISERDLPKEVGRRVTLPDGTSYIISGVYGHAKLMHTAADSGNWFVGWHHPRDPSLVVIHGGREGIVDLFTLRRQLYHILNRYRGVRIEIDADLWLEEEGRQTQDNFADLTQELQELEERKKELEIPKDYVVAGEQQVVSGWISSLHGLSTRLTDTSVNNAGAIKMISDEVFKIASPLSRSTNRYKQHASQVLEEGLGSDDRAKMLGALMQSQIDLLSRSQDIVWKSIGVMNRINDIDVFQKRWNQNVRSLPSTIAHVAAVMDPNYWEDRRNNAMSSFLNQRETGVFAKLKEMSGQPYCRNAQSFIEALSPIGELWERKQLDQIKNLAEREVKRAREWVREIEAQEHGYQFSQYDMGGQSRS